MTSGRLREMVEQDLSTVLQWRNHPDVRQFMYTQHVIAPEEHARWFAKNVVEPGTSLLIYEREGVPRGFVNISATRSASVADWGFYLAPDSGPGTGAALGAATLEYAFARLKLHKLCGEVIGYNARSIRFHERLGFSREGVLRDQYFDGEKYHNVIRFGLLAAEWHQTL